MVSPSLKPNSERAAGLAFIPIITTLGFYLLPLHWQSKVSIQFVPQLSGYLTLGLWAWYNTNRATKLGLQADKIPLGVKWGTLTGVLLGFLNVTVILYVIPAFGGNIVFLRDTPHAHIPFWIMFPGFILFIACAVELNFRGFLLGRLLSVCSDTLNKRQYSSPVLNKLGIWSSLILSALIFSFDPFMVSTFGNLHWIAVWDGLVWGWMWIRFTNLYSVIAAHFVEVLILYLVIRAAIL